MATAMLVETWEFESSSSAGKFYKTQWDQTSGLVSCQCRGWTIKKLNRVRECTHMSDVVLPELRSRGLRVQVREDNWFAERVGKDGEKPLKTLAKKVSDAVLADPKSPFNGVVARGQATMPTRVHTNGFIEPMLAHQMPDGRSIADYDDEWVLEEKFDGIRIGVRVEAGTVAAWSRLENTRALPPKIADAMLRLPDTYVDGELVVRGGASWDVAAGMNSGKELLVVFDVLMLLGKPTMGMPYSDRRALLEEMMRSLSDTPCVLVPPHLKPRTDAMLKKMWAEGREGLMLKNTKAIYRPGTRSDQWLKVKRKQEVTLTIVGYEAGLTGAHAVALLAGTVNGKPVEGKCGINPNSLKAQIERDPDAFLGRQLECVYQQMTPGGSFRHLRMVRMVPR